MKRIILLIAILFSFSYTYAQNRNCPPNEVFCRGGCKPPRQCGIGPPPPGLVVPIDNNVGLLLIAGLGLGIYFFAASGKTSRQSNS